MLSAIGIVTIKARPSNRLDHQNQVSLAHLTRRKRRRPQWLHLSPNGLVHRSQPAHVKPVSRRSAIKRGRVSRPRACLGRRSRARLSQLGLAHSLRRVKPAQGLKRPTSPEGDQALAATAVELAVHNLSFVLRSRRNGCWSLGVSDKRGFRSRQAPQPTRRGQSPVIFFTRRSP